MKRILVIAKAPSPGRVKTRLSPPLCFEDAAGLAEASLRDTLAVVTAINGVEPVVVLDGERGSWLPDGVPVIAQRGHGLAERIGYAFEDAGAPAVLIGMDTPQVTSELLTDVFTALERPGVDAVLGPADDGGWWAIGFNEAPNGAFRGVPMSTPHTAIAQRRRLMKLGLRTALLPKLRDVDTFADVLAVAELIPHSSFARSVRALQNAGAVQWDGACQDAR